MFDWQYHICRLLGCCELEKEAISSCLKQKDNLEFHFNKLRERNEQLNEKIRQLELLVPRPAPPKLDYIVEKDTVWVDAQLQAMGLNIIRLPLDIKYRFTNRKNANNIVIWDTTDRLKYVTDFWDCEDFALLFKVTTQLVFGIHTVCILDYKSGHSYDMFLYTDSEHQILETQNDGMYLWTKRVKDFYSLEGAIAVI